VAFESNSRTEISFKSQTFFVTDSSGQERPLARFCFEHGTMAVRCDIDNWSHYFKRLFSPHGQRIHIHVNFMASIMRNKHFTIAVNDATAANG
jgi:hypothetical protein